MAETNESRPEARPPTAGSRRGRFPSLSVSATIARVETVRMLRRIRSQDVWLALVAVSTLVVVGMMPVVFGIGSDWGEAFAAGDAGPASAITLVVGVAWVYQVAMAVVAGVGSYGEIDEAAGMLTIRPPKDVAGGMLLMNSLSYAIYLAVPFAVGFAGIAAGAGTALPLVGGLLVTFAVLASAMVIGYPIGLALKGVARRSVRLSQLKPVVGAVVVVAYFWVMFAGHLPVVVETLEPVIMEPPVGWLGDLALVTTPGTGASTVGAAATVAITLALVPLGALATVRAATYAWFADQARDHDDGGTADATADGHESAETGRNAPPQHGRPTAVDTRLGSALGLVARRQGTVGVAAATLTRAYRAPLQLVFVAAPLLFALPMVDGIVASGTVPSYAPWVAMLYGAWAAGVAFPLNLLGTQGAALPTLLTAPAGGRRVVHGQVLAAVAPFAPVTAVLAGAAASAGGRSTTAALLVGALALVVVSAGAVVAAGLGALFPRFDGIDVTGGRTAVPPSKAAFALFSTLVVVAVTAAGVLTDEIYRALVYAALSDRVPLDFTVDGLETASLVALVALAVAVPVAYLTAVRRVENYSIE